MNYLAILGAAIVAFAVGALWYGPLFGREWRRLMGIGEGANMGAMPTKAMTGGFVATLILVYVLAGLMSAMQVATVSAALVLAFWLWLGFVATILANSVFYEKRSWNLYLINAAHYLVAIALAAVVLAWWPW